MKLLVYVGAVTEPRKLDILIEMMSFLPQAQLCFVGKRDEDYVSKLQKLSKKLGIENRIWFRGPVHHEQVVNYISGSDLSFVLIPNSSLSYKLSLPNKFFESILAKVPIAIYSHSEEMIKMFGDQTGSLRLDTLSAKELASQVQKFLDSSSPTLSNRLTKSQKFLKKGTLERIEFVKSIESLSLIHI